MALKGRTSRTFLFTTFLVLDISLLSQLAFFHQPTGTVRNRTVPPTPTSMPVAGISATFVQHVYVEGTLDLQVIQQPGGNANYVSPDHGVVTQFATVSQYGNIGLLAHNYLAGKAFSGLKVGQEVRLLYSNGEIESFVITEILRYQALEPRSPYSSFQNMNNENEVLSVGKMFDRVYRGKPHLTFQTCISKNGNSSWGRLFVVAMPKVQSSTIGQRNEIFR